MGEHEALAIKIGERWFRKFGAVGQVQTAWSVAAATLYGPWKSSGIEEVVARLQRLGKKFSLVSVMAESR